MIKYLLGKASTGKFRWKHDALQSVINISMGDCYFIELDDNSDRYDKKI